MYGQLPVKSCCVYAQDMHVIHRHGAWLERYISGFDPTLTSNFSTRDSIHHREHTVLELYLRCLNRMYPMGVEVYHPSPFLVIKFLSFPSYL